jgi:hypothetical protein
MLALPLILALVPHADAKDLRSRFGLGLNQQFGDVSALSLRYGLPTAKPTQNIQIEADAGIAVRDNLSYALVGGRLLYGFVAEDNLNVYGAAGVAYAGGTPVGGGSEEYFVRVQPAFGAEFFLFGLENLGFTVEWGLNLDVGSPLGITTVGSAPAAGFHYYF